jgi:hypothetical protein
LRKYTRIDDPEIIEAVYNQYRDINKATARPSPDVVHSMYRLLSMMRPQKTGRNPDGFVELSFFRELETSGFLEQMKRQYGTGQENP